MHDAEKKIEEVKTARLASQFTREESYTLLAVEVASDAQLSFFDVHPSSVCKSLRSLKLSVPMKWSAMMPDVL